MSRKASDVTVTDMFCGAGGSSIGAARTGARLRMAMNHWKLAIETHNTNFPTADHDCADISASDPRRYPSTNFLIASPECTNHSLAKGQKRKLAQHDLFVPSADDPAAERSRATMWDVPRFAEYHQYEIVLVENVVDAKHWVQYPAWLHAMHLLGYQHREVFLNSMFAHPTPQSRDRMYVVFWKKGNKAPDLEQRHRAHCPKCTCDIESVQCWKPGRSAGRYKRQYTFNCPRCAREVTPYYYAALNAIDWTIPAVRIGDRDKPLRDRTLARVRYGYRTYGRTPLVISTRYTTGVDFRVRDASAEALPTQPGDLSQAAVLPYLIDTAFGHRGDESATSGTASMPTQTTRQTQAIVIPPSFVVPAGSNPGNASPSTRGLPTLTCSDRLAIVINGAAIMTMRDMKYTEQLVRPVTDALGTQVAAGTQDFMVQRAPFLISYYGTMNGGSVGDAMGALSTRDRHALVESPDSPDDVDVNDLYFRMFADHEVGKGMAFPDTYRVLGTKRERVKQYGNAVTPPAMEWLFERCVQSLEAA